MEPSFTRRLATGLAALAALCVLLAGVPLALAATIGNPLPDHLPAPAEAWAALTGHDSGMLLLRFLAGAAWVAWATFTVSVLIELPAAIRRVPTPRLPGLRRQQRLAAALIGAVILVFAAPVTSASAQPLALTAAPYQIDAPKTAASSASHRPDTSDTVQLQLAPTDDADQTDAATQQLIYTVEEDDWLWYIAQRYLGDPNRYPELAEAAGIEDPDVIHPGQQIPLPTDAVDTGPGPHTTGVASAAEAEQGGAAGGEEAEPAPPDGDPTPDDDPESETTPESPTADSTGDEEPSATSQETEPGNDTDERESEATAPEATSTAPGPAEAPSAQTPNPAAPDQADADESGDAGLALRDMPAVLGITAALGGATLLAGLLVIALARKRRRQIETRAPGAPPPATVEPDTEQALHAAADPHTLARLDAALRSLGEALADRPTRPDPVAAWLDGSDLHLLLTEPCPDPPDPWGSDGEDTTWTLVPEVELPQAEQGSPPLPALATIGSKNGTHLLLDLERLGLVTITGEAATALLRYLACELASNTWSSEASVTVYGFDDAETATLCRLFEGRITAAATCQSAIQDIRERANRAIAALGDLNLADTLAGRVTDTGADAWGPHILLVNHPSDGDAEALAELAELLENAGRCGTAVVVASSTGLGRWTVELDDVAALRIDFLGIGPADTGEDNLTAAQLSDTDLAGIAAVFDGDNASAPSPAPADPDLWPIVTIEPETDSDYTDGLAAPVDLGLDPELDAAETEAGHQAVDDLGHDDPASPPAALHLEQRPTDPSLDDDLAAWREHDPSRPRIAVLGEIAIDAPGQRPDKQTRLHTELVVYLAQTGSRGATGPAIDAALWPDEEPGRAASWRRSALTRARKWLGDTPDGQRWLPDLAGGKHYRLREGVLCDWRLFDRLTSRAATTGATDLEAALSLVGDVPMTGADYHSPRTTRTPYSWLSSSALSPFTLVCAITDAAHALVGIALANGDINLARWAINQARLADPDRTTRTIWHDAMRIAHADNKPGELQALVSDLAERQECEVIEDLDAETFALLRELDPVLVGGNAWS